MIILDQSDVACDVNSELKENQSFVFPVITDKISRICLETQQTRDIEPTLAQCIVFAGTHIYPAAPVILSLVFVRETYYIYHA